MAIALGYQNRCSLNPLLTVYMFITVNADEGMSENNVLSLLRWHNGSDFKEMYHFLVLYVKYVIFPRSVFLHLFVVTFILNL